MTTRHAYPFGVAERDFCGPRLHGGDDTADAKGLALMLTKESEHGAPVGG